MLGCVTYVLRRYRSMYNIYTSYNAVWKTPPADDPRQTVDQTDRPKPNTAAISRIQ